jgi:hypothetical protein
VRRPRAAAAAVAVHEEDELFVTWDETRLVVSDTDGSNRTELDTGRRLRRLRGDLVTGRTADRLRLSDRIPHDKAEAQVLWNEDIFVVDADGTRLRRVVSSVGNDRWPPAWSPPR